MLRQNVDCFGVSHTCEVVADNVLQTIQQSLVYEIIEKCHLFRRILQYIIDHILEHALCKHHIILKIRKSDLRLDHPELCRVAGRVGILCSKRRSECVDILECHRISLTIQLSGYSQVGWLIEEILGIVNTSVFLLWNVI